MDYTSYHIIKCVSMDGTKTGRVDYLGQVNMGGTGQHSGREIGATALSEGVVTDAGRYLAVKDGYRNAVAPWFTVELGAHE